MPNLTLRPREQSALRALLAAEPVPGRPIPPLSVLQHIEQLIPCDGMGVVLADNDGYPVDEVVTPLSFYERLPFGDREETGPLYLGLIHWSSCPLEADACDALPGLADGVAMGFRNGPDHVTQLWLDRKSVAFSARDLGMIRLLQPVLQRLLRERPTPRLPPDLTVQERRVLMHVACGRSNTEIAQQLFVAPSTVRKHLEHSYRKLGVTNRVAAVARLQGRDRTDLDMLDRIQKFA